MGLAGPYDFLPIGLVADVPNILVVNNDLPVKTVEDFVKHTRANPGKHPNIDRLLEVIASGQGYGVKLIEA